jgi:nicotinate-nucleotide adenylyltransferase
MTKVGILGGTFDPPHLGHYAIAEAVLGRKLVDAVWFLPCWKHAFGKEPTSFHHRAAMCYLMIKENPQMLVSTAEAEIKSTYSVEILKYLKAGNQGKEFNLILGADNYWKMKDWKTSEEVLSLAPPIWVTRPGVEDPPGEIIQHQHDASSTEVRQLINSALTIEQISRLLAPEVFKYILEHKLYPSA